MADPVKNLAWDDFRLIKAVADVRNLPAAAALLRVNHSTVFRRLGQIEEALGAKLFERHRAGYALTPTGDEMVALAERFDTDISAFARKVAGREPSPAGELNVTTSDALLAHLLTPIFAGFRQRCQDVRLNVIVSDQELNLSRRDADVAIRATNNPAETLVGRRLATIAWAVYGRASDYPQPKTAEWEGLEGRAWVGFGDGAASLGAARYVHERVPPERIGYKVNTVLGLASAIERGLGIGPLPCFVGDAWPTLVRLAPPDPAIASDLWLLTHPDLRHAPRVRVVLDFLAAEIAKRRRFIEGSSLQAVATA